MNTVQTQAVCYYFDNIVALQAVSITLEAAEILALLGHNGAGKTTLMKIILGIYRPKQGEVKVFGLDPSTNDFLPSRFKLGFLPENIVFYPQLTGLETLLFFAKLKRVERRLCEPLLERVGLQKEKNRKIKTYSKGMRQRLGLAQALLSNPKLLILDEPTVGLDPIASNDFYSIIESLRKQGCAIILCSHVLADMERHIDKIAILNRGKLCAYGKLAQLEAQAQLATNLLLKTHLSAQQLQQQLPKSLQTCIKNAVSVDQQTIRLQVQAKAKLALIKALLNSNTISDIQTDEQVLARLYQYYMAKEDL